MTLKSFFSPLINEYAKRFKYMYPCPDEGGFSEASLTTHCLLEMHKMKGYKDLVFWDEFHLPGGDRCDSLVLAPSTKEIVIIEAKNLQTNLSNAPSMAADIARCYKVATDPKIFPERIWKDANNHSVGHVTVADYEKDYVVYGFVIGTVWLPKPSTAAVAEKAFRHSLWNNLEAIPKGELLVAPVDVQNPNVKEQLFIGALFWMIKGKGQTVNSTSSIFQVPPKTGKQSLDNYFDTQKQSLPLVKAVT